MGSVGYLVRMFCESQLAPARHSPQVGEIGMITRGVPLSALNAAANCSILVNATTGLAVVVPAPAEGRLVVAPPHADIATVVTASRTAARRGRFMVFAPWSR